MPTNLSMVGFYPGKSLLLFKDYVSRATTYF